MSLFDLQDVCIAIGSIATLDLQMVVDLIGIYGLKGPYCTLTTTNWFLQALSMIPRGSWGDVARRFTMIRWAIATIQSQAIQSQQSSRNYPVASYPVTTIQSQLSSRKLSSHNIQSQAIQSQAIQSQQSSRNYPVATIQSQGAKPKAGRLLTTGTRCNHRNTAFQLIQTMSCCSLDWFLKSTAGSHKYWIRDSRTDTQLNVLSIRRGFWECDFLKDRKSQNSGTAIGRGHVRRPPPSCARLARWPRKEGGRWRFVLARKRAVVTGLARRGACFIARECWPHMTRRCMSMAAGRWAASRVAGRAGDARWSTPGRAAVRTMLRRWKLAGRPLPLLGCTAWSTLAGAVVRRWPA
ncbi:folate monoglutamate transporter [Dorcoceras hygrometricum]|uniref:Folate monoglutamate transporter n=1 Tax=Dorcoceras hygrometricum TaxID=472368 RepID=A0A2Z7DAC6_9LAMI|nr:folate monoglutamate transporter [Dorcoceras hygrometricum]